VKHGYLRRADAATVRRARCSRPKHEEGFIMEYKLELVLVPVTDVDRAKETLLRAWRGRDGFDGSGLFGAWLYPIASNGCLDTLRRSSPPAPGLRPFAHLPCFPPSPD